MKNLVVFVFISLFFLSSCRNSKTLEGADALSYLDDQELFEVNGVYRHFDPMNSKLYFVKKWNAPAFYSYNGAFNGTAYDWKIFRGTEYGDSVYFIEDKELYSPDFIALVGDSIASVECRFANDNVSDDPRTTAWWLSALESGADTVDIDSFLENIATGAEGIDIEQYIEGLKKEISNVSGKQKLRTYTLAAVPGSSNLPEREYAKDQIGWEYLIERLAVSLSDETARLKIRVPSRK